jgi:hypothetical protein
MRERKVTGKDISPVFIVGYPRSGTTLLFRFLAETRSFGSGASYRSSADHAIETAIGFLCNPLLDFPAILKKPWPPWDKSIPSPEQRRSFAATAGTTGLVSSTWESVLGSLVFRDRHFEPARTDLDDLHQRQMLPGAARSALRSTCVRLSRRSTNLRAFMTLLAQSHNTDRPLEKYPFHYLVMPELLGALPRARFIFMSRQPTDVYRSLLRRARIEIAMRQPFGATSWMAMASPAFALDWNRSVDCCVRFLKAHPDRLLPIRYEDLTTKTVEIARTISKFLDLDIKPPAVAGDSFTTDADARFFLQGPVPVRNNGEHLPELDDYDVGIIRKICREPARRVGH